MTDVAVVGGGWAGLAAAVDLSAAGRTVTLYEMSPQWGGRARRVDHDGDRFDNGQHILIGAYTETLALMRRVGVDPESLLQRLPLTLRYPQGHGLRLPAGPAALAFVRGVLACTDWTWPERIALLGAASGWAWRRFRCDPGWTVARLCAGLPSQVRADLIEPLCVAALNTPAQDASATVFLRVLRDALFSGPGAADLLLPRDTLDTLLPEPATQWLQDHGVELQTGARVRELTRDPGRPGWLADGRPHTQVVLACTAAEAARLTAPLAAAWSRRAAAFEYEPIVTVYVDAPGAQLPTPMLALHADEQAAPAQFVFDHGALSGRPGRLAFVVSGAAPWVARGRTAIADAVMAQATSLGLAGSGPMVCRQIVIEKRATFRCTPHLDRPPATIAEGLVAAGDYTEGPYPATLEGAVRSGLRAARLLRSHPA